MEDSRLRTVAATSAFVTGVYSSVRKLPHPGVVALAAAFNSSVTGASFFGCREFLVSPTLTRLAPWPQYVRRRQELGIESQPEDHNKSNVPVSLPDLRANQLLDSAISGASVVGVFHAISRRPGAIPAMMTAGAVCTLLQYGYNELNIVRLQYISRLREENRPAMAAPSSKARNNSESQQESLPLLESLLSFIGIKSMPEEEYLEKMKKTRESHLKRIVELEQKIQEEQGLKERNKP
ncbi:hypothetical protein CVT25_001072 [Psilocybe cyanescens]|uniref:Uncharacterized protein n=1 Tax=Psilocybe cyanescens TaxID=93625 RepID=A0A409XB24_PSICY|nr:hypothetical protein CVT25_001072 [Psilocybe cyanescens]